MPSRPVTPQPALPIDGTYQLRLAHTGMCVVEKDMDDTGMLYQAPCKFDVVKRVLERQQCGSYLIRTLHPVFGPGCMGVPSDQDGPLLKVEDGYCMDDKRFEQFTFEPVSKPAQGYRIRTAKTGHCLGIQGGSRMEWSKLVQLKCDLNAASQVFVLTRP